MQIFYENESKPSRCVKLSTCTVRKLLSTLDQPMFEVVSGSKAYQFQVNFLRKLFQSRFCLILLQTNNFESHIFVSPLILFQADNSTEREEWMSALLNSKSTNEQDKKLHQAIIGIIIQPNATQFMLTSSCIPCQLYISYLQMFCHEYYY